MDGTVIPDDRLDTSPEVRTRLFERMEIPGTFSIGSGKSTYKYELGDVSAGGLRIINATRVRSSNDVLSGRLTLALNGLEVSSQVTCKIIAIEENGDVRAKFLDISEDMVEFLRSSARSYAVDGRHRTASGKWLPGSAEYQPLKNLKQERGSWAARNLFRFEWVLAALIVALCGAVLLRTGDDQGFWLVKNHEVSLDMPARVLTLNTSFPIAANEPIATLAHTEDGEVGSSFDVLAPIAAQSITWRFNPGDTILPSDVIGILHNAPLRNEAVQAIIGVENPLLDIAVGDNLVFRSGIGAPLEGEVMRTITKSQAAIITGLLSTSLRFDSYYVVEVPVASETTLQTDLELDHLRTLMSHYSDWLLTLRS